MSRYIDAEKIVFKFADGVFDDGVLYVPYRDIQKSVDNTPTADVEKVVRCRDCRYLEHNNIYENDKEFDYRCGVFHVDMGSIDGYCDMGRTKDDRT